MTHPAASSEASGEGGEFERRDRITKRGDRYARRMLVEAAWRYRHRADADLILKRTRQGGAPEIVAIEAAKGDPRLSHAVGSLPNPGA